MPASRITFVDRWLGINGVISWRKFGLQKRLWKIKSHMLVVV
jgi:hypothetical protein